MRIVFKTTYDRDIDIHEHWGKRGAYLALLAVMAVLPFLVGEYYLAEATNTLIWSLAGMGLMVLVGHTGQVSLGHAAFLAIGAYTDAALMTARRRTTGHLGQMAGAQVVTQKRRLRVVASALKRSVHTAQEEWVRDRMDTLNVGPTASPKVWWEELKRLKRGLSAATPMTPLSLKSRRMTTPVSCCPKTRSALPKGQNASPTSNAYLWTKGSQQPTN